jgi:Na+-transporting methylmalonyl-CoA/oxaloacetate decarboxylase gamma subunit
VKSSGSVWFVYGVAVVVTFLVGVLAFSVFVLSKVFGTSSPDEPAPAPAAVAQSQTQPQPRSRPQPQPSGATVRTTAVQVLEVRPSVSDSRQLVLIVATPVGCARNLRATTYAEGPGAIAVRVTQQADRTGCTWQRKPVLATAKAPVRTRTLIVNGTPWTPTATGRYEHALRASTS